MELLNNELANIGNISNYESRNKDDNLCGIVYNESNNIGTSSCDTNSFQDSEENNKTDKKICEKNADNSINIFRYKFTTEFTEELFKFSKIHQYDHRKDFKEAWEKWTENNSEIIDDEVRRLKNLGYEGDILDKMFKSARYYFRKKSTEKKEPVKRRIYVGSQKELLEAMDDHIKVSIESGNFKPSDGFDEFCKENIEILKEQVTQLCRAGIKDPNEIKSKIKKTYKNRYFLAIK